MTVSDRRPKAADAVAGEIKRRIATRELLPGDRLPVEDELMSVFKVARTSLREGLRILEAQGLVTVERGRTGGSRIAEPTIDPLAHALALRLQIERTTMADLGEARGLIEPWLAARLAEHATREDLGALDDVILAAGKAASSGDRLRFAAAVTAVHDLVAERGRNTTLAVVSRMLHEVGAWYYRRATSQSAAADMARATRSYRRLYQLVSAHDIEGTKHHWEAQLRYTTLRQNPAERLAVSSNSTTNDAKTADTVAADLRDRIARGALVPGDRLPTEDELMRAYKVARPSLREAMRLLESQGVLVVQRGRAGGARIIEPSVDALAEGVSFHLQLERTTFRDLNTARELIEPWLASRIAARPRREDLGALEDAIIAAEEAAAACDRSSFAEAAAAVHNTVAQRGGNQTLALISRTLQDLTTDYYRTASSHSAQSEMARATRSYRRLLRLLAVGDVEGVRAHWAGQMAYASSRQAVDERVRLPDVYGDGFAELSFGLSAASG
jgi:DNA-binding FadR family transcriptional regulator